MEMVNMRKDKKFEGNRNSAGSKSAVQSSPARESTSIYARENVPMVGATFSSLSTMRPYSEALPEGVALGAGLRILAMVHMPVDRFNSFDSKMAELYAEIRETNAGAANYTHRDLGRYVLYLMGMHAWAHQIMRTMAAFRATLPNSADSPYVLTAVSGLDNYDGSVATLGDSFNDLAILVKDIENLPVPPLGVFERVEYLYNKLFADSEKEKPSLIGFVPFTVMLPSLATEDAGTYKFTPSTIASSATLATWIAALRTMYAAVATDSVFTILRGDLRKAFGNQAYPRKLTTYLTTPLRVEYLTGEIRAQLENAGYVWQTQTPVLEADETTGIFSLKFPVTVGASKVTLKPETPEQLINYHGAQPTPAEMLQITRFMPVMEWVDPLLDTKAQVVKAASGDTIYNMQMIYEVTASAITAQWMSTLTSNAQNSIVQSTAMDAMRDLAFMSSVIDGFPMIITDPDSPRGYIWNLDNFAVLSATELNTYHERTVRSWFTAHVPRGEMGRVERHP